MIPKPLPADGGVPPVSDEPDPDDFGGLEAGPVVPVAVALAAAGVAGLDAVAPAGFAAPLVPPAGGFVLVAALVAAEPPPVPVELDTGEGVVA